MTEAERNALIEECAIAAEQQDRAGREWVRDSLWAAILHRAGNNVRLLKKRPITPNETGLSVLRQAIIDNTHGDLFWIGEILLNELQKETGYPPKEPAITASPVDPADPTGTIKHMWAQIEAWRRTLPQPPALPASPSQEADRG